MRGIFIFYFYEDEDRCFTGWTLSFQKENPVVILWPIILYYFVGLFWIWMLDGQQKPISFHLFLFFYFYFARLIFFYSVVYFIFCLTGQFQFLYIAFKFKYTYSCLSVIILFLKTSRPITIYLSAKHPISLSGAKKEKKFPWEEREHL